jgi:hypothetical protein
MNRQQRRAWARGMQQVQDDAAGALELFIIRPPELPDLIAAAAFSVRAKRLASLAVQTIVDVYDAPTADPACCMSCCRPVVSEDAFSVVLGVPHRADPHKCVAAIMCADCGTDLDEIQTKAIASLKTLWPEIRPIRISDQEGHA